MFRPVQVLVAIAMLGLGGLFLQGDVSCSGHSASAPGTVTHVLTSPKNTRVVVVFTAVDGQRVSFLGDTSFFSHYHVGDSVIVHYDRQHPQRAEFDNSNRWILVVVFALPAVVAIGFPLVKSYLRS